MGRKNQSAPVQNTAQTSPKPTNANVFSSIKDALSKSVSLQCDYTDDSGRKTIAYIKAGAVRSDYTGKTAQESGSIIIKDKKMYFWNGKQGMMIQVDPSEMMGSITPSAQKTPSEQQKPGDVVNTLEKFKESCKPSVVADSLFTPPTDVKFTDFSEIMKTSTKQITPGVTVGGAMTEEQIKALQQQYQK